MSHRPVSTDLNLGVHYCLLPLSVAPRICQWGEFDRQISFKQGFRLVFTDGDWLPYLQLNSDHAAKVEKRRCLVLSMCLLVMPWFSPA